VKACAIAIAIVLAGCDSLVDAPCLPGFTLESGECVADTGGQPPDPPEPVDPTDPQPVPVCTADTDSDARNCGVCGHECESGICELGRCLGELPGHVVAIGHDFGSRIPAMERILANGGGIARSLDVPGARLPGNGPKCSCLPLAMKPNRVCLRVSVSNGTSSMDHSPNAPCARSVDVPVARVRGNGQMELSAPVASVLDMAMPLTGRSWHEVELAVAEAVIVEALHDEPTAAHALAGALQSSIDHVLARGGVVIVLVGQDSTSTDFARGAGLFDLSAPPVGVSGSRLTVAIPSDSVVTDVVSPYLAAETTVTLPGAGPAVVTTTSGEPVIVHLTR